MAKQYIDEVQAAVLMSCILRILQTVGYTLILDIWDIHKFGKI